MHYSKGKIMILNNRVALVTGAGSGMGRASAIKLASEGARVIVASRSKEGIEETAEMINAGGNGSAEAFQVDITNVDQLRVLFNHIDHNYGKLNILFNHAGSPGPGGLAVTEEDFYQTVDMNLKGAFYCTSLGEPLLRKAAGEASVIFTSSVSGVVGSLFSPIYSMVKSGLVGFTKALSLSLAPDIRVNVICPGAVETPMLSQFFGRDPKADIQANVKNFVDTAVPLRRVCTAEEIAEAVLFLASDKSSFITGTSLPIDGGYTAR